MTQRMYACVCTALGMIATPLVAQRAASPAQVSALPANASQIVADRSSGGRDALDARLNVELDDVPMKLALEEIMSRSGVAVLYSSVVPLDRRVTVRGKDITLEAALTQVLRGTGLRAQRSPDGQIVIARDATQAAQAMGTITGKILHAKTKAPIASASITVDDATKGVPTGEDGTFRMPATAGRHRVHVRAVGFVRITREITVTEGQSVVLEIPLEPSASVLDEVVVTGTVVATERKAIPTPITVITADDIEKRGLTRVDQLFRGEIPGLLALDRGTTAYNDAMGEMAKSTIYSRGSTSLDGRANPIKTYVDGVELLDPSYLGTIDPQSIERIEIITGPQAATIYGSGAMGGVMQIFTKKGSGRSTPDVTLTLKYGTLENNFSSNLAPSHNDALQVTGGTGPEFSYSGTMSHNFTGQWQPGLFSRAYGGSIGATHTRGGISASGSVAATRAENGTSGYCGATFAAASGGVGVGGGTLYAQTGGANGEWSPKSYNCRTQQRSTAASQTLSLNVDYRVTSVWQHHLTVGRNWTDLGLIPVAPGFSSRADSLYKISTSTGNRTTMSYNTTLVPRFGMLSSSLTLGATGSAGTELQNVGCLPTKSSTTYVGCSAGVAPTISKSRDDKSWGGFGSAQLGMWDRFYLTFALRGERNPNYGSDHPIDWTPTTGATYTLEHGDMTIKFLASYGRVTRPPAADARKAVSNLDPARVPAIWQYQIESPDLTPEYSRGPQGGIEVYYGNLGSLTINHYRQTTDNLIQAIEVGDSLYLDYPTYGFGYWTHSVQNLNTASMRQIGWSGTASLNLGPVSLKGVYSFDDSRVTKLSPLVQFWIFNVGQSIQGIPTHTGSFTIGYARGATSVTWVTNYVGSTILYGPHDNLDVFLASFARLRMYSARQTDGLGNIASAGYVKSDFAASHRVTSWATATLNVMNVGNQFTSDMGGIFPSLGRSMLFGLSLRNVRGR